MSEKGGRISDRLKSEVEEHERRLRGLSHKLSHANTHLVALGDISQRLRFHLDVQKSRRGQSLAPPKDDDETENTGYKSAKEDLHFKFPDKNVTCERDFLTMVESLIEGILLVASEVNLGKVAKEITGPAYQTDLQNWRQVVNTLQKYDDQVRRAIEYFERLQPEKEDQSTQEENAN